MRTRSLLLILLILIVVSFFGKLIIDAGAFRPLSPHFSGACREIKGIPGPEDLEYESESGLVFISSDTRPERHGEKTKNGAIYILDPRDPSAQPIQVSKDLGFTFHPHGLSLFNDKGRITLFVINHRESEGTIEVFEWREKTLTHLRTIRSSLLKNHHNDVAAVSPTGFYVSHEQGSETPLLRSLESYSRVGLGNIMFYDGNEFSVKAKGLGYGNGLTLTKDGRSLFVAEMLKLQVRVYERDPVTNDLRQTHVLAVGSGPDNLVLDEDGHLWIGAHPNLFKLKTHSQNHSTKAPAQILKIENPLSATPKINEVFLDDGQKLSSASIAVPVGSRLFIGSIFEDRMLDCTRP